MSHIANWPLASSDRCQLNLVRDFGLPCRGLRNLASVDEGAGLSTGLTTRLGPRNQNPIQPCSYWGNITRKPESSKTLNNVIPSVARNLGFSGEYQIPRFARNDKPIAAVRMTTPLVIEITQQCVKARTARA